MAGRYRADQGALNQLLYGRTGPVQLHVANKGREVEGYARRLVGVKSGETRAGIYSRVVLSNPGYNVEVGARSKAMPYHHDGTKPHIIRPRRKRALKFQAGGRTVFAKKVNHPGTRANPFLIRAGQAAGLRVRRR